MEHIKDIEEQIESYIQEQNLNGPSDIFIVLNKTYINKYCDINVNSICLYLAIKYKGMQWPKLCVDDDITILLFIGRCE